MKKFSPKFGTKKAFTLVELLVSMAVFVIFLGVVSTTYVNIVHSQRSANEVRKMYSDVRDFVELISQEARLESVDYDCYTSHSSANNVTNDCLSAMSALEPLSDGKVSYVALVNKDHTQRTIFKFVQPTNTTPGKLQMQRWVQAVDDKDTTGWRPADDFPDEFRDVLSESVDVRSAIFLISPTQNPYSDNSDIYSNSATQFQPQVTILLSLKNGKKMQTEFHSDFQTTISSRVYSRKSS